MRSTERTFGTCRTLEQIEALVEETLRGSRYLECDYFADLASGRFSFEDFVETQIQFLFAVLFFARPMAVLAARIPTANMRVEILRNVWEEHGSGNTLYTHANTFEEFLKRLANLSDDEIEARGLWPEVRIFNTMLVGCCAFDEWITGCAMMGTIERMFTSISSFLGRTVVARGWLPAERMVHYNLHEELDTRHSRDFYELLAPPWAASAENRYAIEQGILLGSSAFLGLYEDLSRHRGRRYKRSFKGPHTRA